MEKWLEYVDLETVVIPAAITIAIIVVLMIVRSVLLRVVKRWAARTTTQIDDTILSSFRVPSFYWVIAIGIYLGIATSELPARYVAYLTKAIYILIIFSMTMALANLSGKIFTNYVQKLSLPIPTSGLAQGIIKGTIIVVGMIIILGVVGISITPLITALGVGGLAVALALQDTLANLFAGIHILVEKSIRVGDFIKLESGEQGYVDDITWRTTRIKMLPNNMVIIPNNKLSQSIVTNYYLPEKMMSLLVPVGVSYSADPEVVERVLMEEILAAVGEIPGLLKEPAPFVRFIPGFGESSLDFTIICKVAEFTDQYLAQHEIRKRVFKRFKKEGIDIPFPHRTVYLREEKEWKK